MGLDSHGVMRVPQYVHMIRDGGIRPGAKLFIVNDHRGSATLDCNYNFGQLAGNKAVELVIERAREYGVSCVLCRRCGHTGRVGAYTQMAAEAGMVALASSNGQSKFLNVAPFGGREGRLATNPISFAAPSGSDPILIDMATSIVSEGKIRTYRDKGRPVPEGWILDQDGRHSTDAKGFYGPPRGAILPLGGEQGYKGYFLALMVEILCGALAGDSICQRPQEGSGLCLLAIDVGSFGQQDQFRDMLDELVAHVKSSAPLEDGEGVTVPGEREFKTAEIRRKQGIPIPEATWQLIVKVCGELNVTPPASIS